MFRSGSVEIDFDRVELRVSGAPRHVEPQVFAIIRYLIEQRHRAVSKDELIDVVWNGRVVSDSTVASRINAARRALDDSGKGQTMIRTLPKTGFRFVGPTETLGEHPEPDFGRPAAATAPGRPVARVLVLPFRGPHGAQDLPALREGLTEDTISMLSRFHELEVIAAATALRLHVDNGHPLEHGRRLGADYLVEGSLRVSDERIRVAIELCDVRSQAIVWAQTFDRHLGSLFDMQDEIARQIAASIEPGISLSESHRAAKLRPGDVSAWMHFHQGVSELYRFSADALDRAEAHLTACLAALPDFAPAEARLAYVYLQRYWYGPHSARAEMQKEALRRAAIAADLDASDAFARFVLGRALALGGHHAHAIAELREAVRLNPSFAQAHFGLGQALFYADRSAEAEAPLAAALRLSPQDRHLWTFNHVLALVLFDLGRLEEARRAALRAVTCGHATHWAYATLAAIEGALGEAQEARNTLRELAVLAPDYSLAFARQDLAGYMLGNFADKYLAGLAAAGLAERRAP